MIKSVEKIKLDNDIDIDKVLNEALIGIESNIDNISGKIRLSNSNARNIEKLVKYVENCKDEVITRSISLILSVSLTIGSGVGAFMLAKKISNHDYYKQITTSYSSCRGIDSAEKLVAKSEVSDDLDKVYLNFYGVWKKTSDDTYKRIIKKYDVSDFKFDNIEDYLNYSIDYYNTNCEIIEQEKEFPRDLYMAEYIEVEKSVINPEEKIEYLDIIDFVVALGILYVIYIFSLLGFVYFSEGEFIFGQTGDLIDALKEYKRGKKITKSEMRRFNKLNNEILKIVNNNDWLKTQFSKLYETNIYLLDNPEELYQRFDNLNKKIDTDNIKKLVMKKA